MKDTLISLKHGQKHLYYFAYWVFVGLVVGIIVGLCGSIFAHLVSQVTNFRIAHPILLLTLPLLGLFIIFMYKHTDKRNAHGTNLVLLSVRTEERIPLIMAPVIFIATVLSHLGGASAGREGAALQIGASISQSIGQLLKSDEKSMHIYSMCGMSACFAALFGTPVAASIFSLEVISVGIMQYSALIPCTISALVANFIAKSLHVHHMSFNVATLSQSFSIELAIKIGVLAIVAALVSIVFCILLNLGGSLYKKYFKNPYVRVVFGAILTIILTIIFQTSDYMGAGENLIMQAINGESHIYSFILKMLFTAICLEAGFKGGEIVPTLAVGAAFGCAFAPLVGLDSALAASLAMIALFCGVTNCPIASVFLGLELLNGQGIEWLIFTVAIAYMLSGYYSIYNEQKIMYSKDVPNFINKQAN